jgi:hypothetical protein
MAHEEASDAEDSSHSLVASVGVDNWQNYQLPKALDVTALAGSAAVTYS